MASGVAAPKRSSSTPPLPRVAIADSVLTRPGFTVNARMPRDPYSTLTQPASRASAAFDAP